MDKNTLAIINKEEAAVAIITSDKINFRIKSIIRDKEDSITKDIPILNMYTSNKIASKFLRLQDK